MEKAIKHLIIKSINLRNWTTLSNYIATHSVLTDYENLQDTSLPKKWKRNKEYIQKNTFFKSDNNPEYMIKNNKWDSKETFLKAVINHLKFSCTHSNYEHIRNSKECKYLCTIIQRNLTFLNIDNITQVLNTLLQCGVPPETEIIQMLLQFIKLNINDLSVRETILVYHLLKDKRQSPLIKALLHALPIVFYNRIQLELDGKNMITLLSALIFACKLKHQKTLTYILNIMSKDKIIVTCDLARYTLYALSLLPKQSINISLLHQVYDLIIDKGQLFRFKEINFLIFLITKEIKKCRNVNFYNEDVLCTLCTAALDKNLCFHESEKLLKNLNRIHYSHIPLLNHAATQFIEDRYYSKSMFQICTLIRALSIADYKPESWATMQSTLSNYISHNNIPIDYLAVVALDLLSLGCCNAEVLEEIFTTFYCTHDSIKDSTKVDILMLHQGVKTLYPSYNGVTLSENLLNKLIEQVKFIEIPALGNILKNVVGGAQYIKNGLTTKLGHFINYAIIIQPDGSPMVLNDINDVIFIEELASLPEYSKLFFLAFPLDAYCINTQQLTSIWRMQKQSLETLFNCKVVAINMHLWNNFSNNRKEQYLQEALQTSDFRC